MIALRRAGERGQTREDWLDSRHTFAFGSYEDPVHRGFHSLRVINEDRVAPAHGFPLHPHRDMEILSLVLRGRLEHRDDRGGHAVIGPGEAQRITAGRGIRHSERNPSAKEEVHFLQIWIFPEARDLAPDYEVRDFPAEGRRNRLQCLASAAGSHGSLVLRQDATVYRAALETGAELEPHLALNRHAWLQMISGRLNLNGQPLHAGDGAAVSEEPRIRLTAEEPADLLFFDLA